MMPQQEQVFRKCERCHELNEEELWSFRRCPNCGEMYNSSTEDIGNAAILANTYEQLAEALKRAEDLERERDRIREQLAEVMLGSIQHTNDLRGQLDAAEQHVKVLRQSGDLIGVQIERICKERDAALASNAEMRKALEGMFYKHEDGSWYPCSNEQSAIDACAVLNASSAAIREAIAALPKVEVGANGN